MAAEPSNVAQWIAAYAAEQVRRLPAERRREALMLAAQEIGKLANDPARSPSAFMRAVAHLEPVNRAPSDYR